MEEQKIKAILINKLSHLEEFSGQMKRQVQAVDGNDEQALTQVLNDKETVIESLAKDDQELEKHVALLDEKSRAAIAKNLKELGAQIETVIEGVVEMENDCEKKLINEKQGLYEKMKSMKTGRTLLKGYGLSTRIKPKISDSI